MALRETLSLLVLLLAYLGLALGGLPGYRMNRAGVALVGASLLVLLGALDLEEAWRALDPSTLVFLFGVMVLNAHLGYAGFFGWVAEGLWKRARTPFALLVLLSLGSGLLSALFLNDTMAPLLTPPVLRLARGLGLNPVPYLLALMAGVNTGSLMTPTGNPQNILVASLSGMAYLDFPRALLPVAFLGLALQVGLLPLPKAPSAPSPFALPAPPRASPQRASRGLGAPPRLSPRLPHGPGGLGGGGASPLHPEAPLGAVLHAGGLGASGDVRRALRPHRRGAPPGARRGPFAPRL